MSMELLFERKDCRIASPALEMPSYCLHNPSPFVFGGELYTSFRASTVEKLRGSIHRRCLPPHEGAYSEIVLARLDANLQPTQVWPVETRSWDGARLACPSGFEDLRPFASADGQRLEAFASIPSFFMRDGSNAGITQPNAHVALGRLTFGNDFALTDVSLYPSPFDLGNEKNWGPFYHQGRLLAVYYWDPLIVIECGEGGNYRIIRWHEKVPELDGFRGSSQGIPHGDGYLFVVHRRRDNDHRIEFVHRLVRIGPDLAPTHVSRPFRFLSRDVLEYCAGVARWEDRLVFGLGIEDVKSCFVSINAAEMDELLEPVQKPGVVSDIDAAVARTRAQLHDKGLRGRLRRRIQRWKKKWVLTT